MTEHLTSETEPPCWFNLCYGRILKIFVFLLLSFQLSAQDCDPDTTPPILSCPDDVICFFGPCSQADPGQTGMAVVFDDCDSSPLVDFSDSAPSPFGFECNAIVIRTWTAVDAAGNSTSCDQIIDCIADECSPDVLAPEISCPDDVICFFGPCELADPFQTGMATATDNCDLNPDIDFSDSDPSPFGFECNAIVIRTWTAIDDAGNSTFCEQIIDCEDTQGLEVFCPDDITLECGDDTSPANTGTATSDGGCNIEVSIVDITYTDEILFDDACFNPFAIVRTWTAADACDDFAECIQLINFVETTPPTILSCPLDATVECNDDTSPAILGMAEGEDACGSTSISSEDQLSSLGCCEGQTITRVWTLSDDCNNSTNCTQVITILPLDCDDGDPCTEDFCVLVDGIAVCVNQVIECDDGDPCTDDVCIDGQCVSIPIEDNEAPMITCPGDVICIFEDCQFSTPDVTGTATATDNCDDVVDVTFSDQILGPQGAECNTLLSRIWTATDDAGNSTFCEQIIDCIGDDEPLTITCPPDEDVECGESTDPIFTGFPDFEGGCFDEFDVALAIPVIDFEDVSFQDETCESPSGIERIWTVQDDCEGFDQCIQIILFLDNTPPVVYCPIDVTVVCGEDTSPQFTGEATATDLCFSNVELFPIDLLSSSDCCDGQTITRTWFAFDDCDNGGNCVQIITVIPPDCDDGDPCTIDFCEVGEGGAFCVNEPIDCDDGDPCTIDFCDVDDNGNAICVNEPIDCDDGDPCTIDFCVVDDNGNAICVNEPVDCDDGDPCTIDFCVVDDNGNAVCVNEPIDCDDNDPCTLDFCVVDADGNAVCVNEPIDCDDGDPCTIDFCVVDADGNAVCVNEPIDCDDGDPCTIDFCIVDDNGNAVCVNEPIDCDDGDPCTIDFCIVDDGVAICINEPINCDDGDPCTIDFCIVDDNGNAICVNEPVDCDDGDPCTIDFCIVDDNGNAVCVNEPIDCDDGDPCTIDFCIVDDNGNAVCVNEPIDCDDGDPCTIDFCIIDDNGNAVCINEPNNCDDGDPCTFDSCDPNTGECINTPLVCEPDDNPCTEEVCIDGQCVSIPIDCDDGDPCTIDICDPDTGDCIHIPIQGCSNDPPTAVCKTVTYFVDPNNPDYNGPGNNDIFLIPASALDGGSTSSGTPTIEVRRISNYINFDWTTNGACIDLSPNGNVNNKDRGKVYRPCLPTRPADINRNRRYLLRITDEYGTDQCKGRYKIKPQVFDFAQPIIHINDLQDVYEDEAPEIEGRSGQFEDAQFSVVPTPGVDQINLNWVTSVAGESQIFIRDLSGRVIHTQSLSVEPGQNRLVMDVSRLTGGVYVISVANADSMQSVKWIKAD